MEQEIAQINPRMIDFRYAPRTSWTAICRPDDPFKTLVREDGALLYDLVSDRTAWGFTRVVKFALRTTAVPVAITQLTESSRTPIVVTTIRYPDATLVLRAFAHLDSDGSRSDVVLWEIQVDHQADEFLAQLLISAQERSRIFTGRSAEPSNAIYAVDIQNVPVVSMHPSSLLVGSVYDSEPELEVQELAFVSMPHRLEPVPSAGFGPIPSLATEAVLTQPGDVLRGALVFPLNHGNIDGIDHAWAERALADERAFWESYELLRLPFEIPDPQVMDIVVASVRNTLQAREIVDGLPEFRVGSATFRGLWVVDGHFMLEAAQYLGYAQDAGSAVEVLLRRSRDDGAISEMPFHIKETAIALATFVRQSELLGDEALLHRIWPRVRRAVSYIEELRKEAYALPDDSPAYGLLPPAFPDGGIGGIRAEYTSALWTLAGLKSIAGAAARLGYADDATHFQQLYDSLMADFRTHASRGMQYLADGSPYLPMAKPESGNHTWIADFAGETPPWRIIHPQTGTWALAQAIYPGEIFSPEDPLVTSFLTLLDSVDDDQGVPKNTAFWTYRMIWTYSASFYAHAWLFAGEADKAADYLYAFANHAAPTRVWREEQPMASSPVRTISGDMPHNWASGEFIRLVRHLLILERGEQLEFLAGMPREWLVSGHPVRLERSPTRFGPVSLEVTLEDSRDVIVQTQMDPAWSRKPEDVLLRLPTGYGGATLIEDGGETPLETHGDRHVVLPLGEAVRLKLLARNRNLE